jgi:endonuclease YncB( thermonuclease family)
MEGLYCPVDRYHITNLAEIIHGQQPEQNASYADQFFKPNLGVSDIAEVLKGSVNIRKEKVSPEHRGEFTKENSISAQEAYKFIRRLRVSGSLEGNTSYAIIGRSLHDIFFGGNLFSPQSIKPRPVKILECHDADTCRVVVSQPDECNSGPATVSVRISGVDAPEVGYYSEQKADASRGKGSIYGKSPRRLNAGSWINPKLVGNVDEIHLALSKGKWNTKKISYKDRVALNAIIAATIDYTGMIATIANNDLIKFELDKSEYGAALMIDSQIRWTSSDTPESLCGSLQPCDIYGRYLSSFLSEDGDRLVRYVRDQLPISMKTQGRALYNKYIGNVAKHIKALRSSKNPAIRDAANALVRRAAKPEVMYSKAKCAKLARGYDKFLDSVGGLLDGDIQAMQIYTGMIFEYAKYLNQRGAIYKMAGDIARKSKTGQWTDLSLITLWNANLKKPRYHPDDCMAK